MAHFRNRFSVPVFTLLLGSFSVACSSAGGSSSEKGASNDNRDVITPGAGTGVGNAGAETTGSGATGSGGSSSAGTGVSFGAAGTSEGSGTSSGAAAATGAAPSDPTLVTTGSSGVAAGEWDDNANYREFLAYIKASEALDFARLDVSQRQFIAVVDSAGQAIADCPLTVSDGTNTTSLMTMASGRTPLFPHAVGLVGGQLSVVASCAEGAAQGSLSTDGEDNLLVLHLAAQRAPAPTKSVELAFILDTTGSMSEEIDAIKTTISTVADKLTPQQGISLRVGLVAYKDYGSEYVTKTFPFSTDLAAFRTSIASLSAGGGGDIPEAVNEAMHVTGELDWHADAFARFAFLVADAPPHMHEQYDYSVEAIHFLSRGIQVFTVNASGQDAVGQVVFRQISQYTYATNMFVLRGGAGPQSAGGGDPTTSCGRTQTSYASGNLDQLIVQKVLDEVALYDHDPLDIPGLHTDQVVAAPCGDAGSDAGAETSAEPAADAGPDTWVAADSGSE